MAYRIFRPGTGEENASDKRRFQRIALLDVGRDRIREERPGHNENQYNLALGYLGAALIHDGHEVMILQQGLGQGPESKPELTEEIKRFNPQAVGFSSYTYQYPETLRFKRALMEALPPGIPTIIGGIHASVSMQECAEDFGLLFSAKGRRLCGN